MSRPAKQRPAHREAWEAVASGPSAEAASAVAQLAAARQSPPEARHAAALLSLLEASDAGEQMTLPVLALLARWARQQALQPAAARNLDLLHRSLAAAEHHLARTLVPQPGVAPACLLLLGSTAPALAADSEAIGGIVEAAGNALLGSSLGPPLASAAADAMAAVGAVLPCLLGKPVASCWLLGALLQWLGGWEALHSGDSGRDTAAALDSLAPAYAMLRGTAMTALARAPPADAVAGLLRPAYSVLKHAAPAARTPLDGSSGSAEPATAAAAVLCLGGLAEGLLRSAAGFPEAAQLADEAVFNLLAACDAVAAAAESAINAAAHAALPARSLELLRDACSLAVAQLTAAVRPPQLVGAGGPARCQVQSLLHSAVSLAPLRDVAAALPPPSEAAARLQRHAASALAQQAGVLARSLADQMPALRSSARDWVLQHVAAAALAAHQQYRAYSLFTPSDWLASIDGTAVRQMLDRLFLACLVLLDAAWQDGSAPGAAAQPQRAQRAATVLAALADLQFCRVASPQYAALLRAALAEVPGDGGAAASLAAALPCYAQLAAPLPARGGQPAWLADGVAAAKLQLLVHALVPCCATLPQTALQERLAPLTFLYLLHPHRPLAAAAHQLFCALLLAAPPLQREPLAAFYVRRCMEGFPDATLGLLPDFGQGLATILQSLPLGSPVALLCLQDALERWQALAASGDPGAGQLAAVVAQQLLLVDHSLLGEAMAAFEPQLRWADAEARAAAAAGTPAAVPGAAAARPALAPAATLRCELLASVQRSTDSVRKPALARWLLQQHASAL